MSKVPHTERSSTDRGEPPTASELKVVPIFCKESWEGKGCMKRRVVDGPALNDEEKAYLLARDVVKGLPANVNWERLDVLDYIGLRHFLDREPFCVLSVKSRDFCMNTMRQNRLTTHETFNSRQCRWGLKRKLKLKTVMNVPCGCNPRKLVYAQRLEKRYQQLQSSNPPVFGLACCCFDTPSERMQLLSY